MKGECKLIDIVWVARSDPPFGFGHVLGVLVAFHECYRQCGKGQKQDIRRHAFFLARTREYSSTSAKVCSVVKISPI